MAAGAALVWQSRPMSLFRVEHLRKKYGTNTVVDDLSLHLDAGECLGVIGPNGAGKTTTIRMCLGLVAPDTGHIEAFGLPNTITA